MIRIIFHCTVKFLYFFFFFFDFHVSDVKIWVSPLQLVAIVAHLFLWSRRVAYVVSVATISQILHVEIIYFVLSVSKFQFAVSFERNYVQCKVPSMDIDVSFFCHAEVTASSKNLAVALFNHVALATDCGP